jgi:hypothetical protein
MRIDASNLLAAQAARAPQRAQPPMQKTPEQAKPVFERMDFAKQPDVAAAHAEPKPAQQSAQPMRKGSHLDITV